ADKCLHCSMFVQEKEELFAGGRFGMSPEPRETLVEKGVGVAEVTSSAVERGELKEELRASRLLEMDHSLDSSQGTDAFIIGSQLSMELGHFEGDFKPQASSPDRKGLKGSAQQVKGGSRLKRGLQVARGSKRVLFQSRFISREEEMFYRFHQFHIVPLQGLAAKGFPYPRVQAAAFRRLH